MIAWWADIYYWVVLWFQFCDTYQEVPLTVSCNSWWWPDKPKYVYWVALLFQCCDTHLEVTLTVSCNSWWWPDKPKYINWMFLLSHFRDTYLAVTLINISPDDALIVWQIYKGVLSVFISETWPNVLVVKCY